MSAAVFYHFYPHYRKGVIEALLRDEGLNLTFFGGGRGVEGIREHQFCTPEHFNEVATYRFHNLVFQPRLVWLCLTGDFKCFIFLADPNHLTTWMGALICRMRRRRVIFWGHGFKSERASWKNVLRKSFFRLSDGLFTYGYRAKLIAIRLGFDSDSVYVGFNSLDYDKQLAVREKLLEMRSHEKGREFLRIVCISRLTTACRYDVLIDAVMVAKAAGKLDIRITFIGDGPELDSLRSQAHRMNVHADFLGAEYDEERIAPYLFDADVTVSPGKIGLTAMHSLMYGTPVISNSDFVAQGPEVEAIVSGFTGDLFERDNVQDLADQLLIYKARYPNRDITRRHCFRMIDSIYNPGKQVEIMRLAIQGAPALTGDDAFQLFEADRQ